MIVIYNIENYFYFDYKYDNFCQHIELKTLVIILSILWIHFDNIDPF